MHKLYVETRRSIEKCFKKVILNKLLTISAFVGSVIFSEEFKVLGMFPNIWTDSPFQKCYCLPFCCDLILHAGLTIHGYILNFFSVYFHSNSHIILNNFN